MTTTPQSHMEILVQNMAEGAVLVNPQGDIVVLNAPAEKLLGAEGEAAVKDAFRILGVDRVLRDCQSKKTVLREEIQLQRKEGASVLELEVAPVKMDNGGIGVAALLRDITKQKEVDRMKTEFISTVSHELRTPLAITKEGVSLVLDGATGEINEDQKEILETAKTSIDRLARLINDLLDISKLEAGRIELHRERVKLKHLLDQVGSDFAARFEQKQLDWMVQWPQGDEVEIYADYDKLYQVFTNLVGNAYKFTEQGSIEVMVQDQEGEFECVVKDTGKGMAEDALPKVFDRFQQIGRVEGGGEKGTGLGLAIVKGLIELHRGKIWVESRLGQGTQFHFTLPAYGTRELFKEKVIAGRREASRLGVPLSIIVFHIKQGGAAASPEEASVVNYLAKCVQDSLRRQADTMHKSDQAVLVVLPGVGKKGAGAVIRRIEKAFKELLGGNSALEAVPVDVQMANYPEDGNTEDALLEKAGIV